MKKKTDSFERNERIFAQREKGASLNEIAKHFHLSRARVHQIYLKMKDRKEDFDSWPPLKKACSLRVQNALESYFVNENILENPKKLADAGRYKIESIRNIGKKSIKEIAFALYELGYIKDPDEWLKPYRSHR